jgi:WD40 repeat protein
VASSSCDGTVRLWNVADKRCVAKWDKVLICSFYTRAEKYSEKYALNYFNV